MRIWLAGSRSFGLQVLTALSGVPKVEVVAVTAPEADLLWEAALERSLQVCHGVFPHWVERYGVDCIVSAQNYAHIGREAREAARLGAIGYHPSLLPRHRGRSAVEWTIAMGDPIAGGTVYRMDDGWDTGPIILQDFCHVLPDWTASELWRERLFPMGIRLLTGTIAAAAAGLTWNTAAQDERAASTEPTWESAGAH